MSEGLFSMGFSWYSKFPIQLSSKLLRATRLDIARISKHLRFIPWNFLPHFIFIIQNGDKRLETSISTDPRCNKCCIIPYIHIDYICRVKNIVWFQTDLIFLESCVIIIRLIFIPLIQSFFV